MCVCLCVLKNGCTSGLLWCTCHSTTPSIFSSCNLISVNTSYSVYKARGGLFMICAKQNRLLRASHELFCCINDSSPGPNCDDSSLTSAAVVGDGFLNNLFSVRSKSCFQHISVFDPKGRVPRLVATQNIPDSTIYRYAS